jgi:hypothetical protein
MIRGGNNLFFHHLRARFILVTPEWDLGLLVAGESRRGVPNQLPLCPAGPMNFFITWINVVVGKVVTADTHRIGFFVFHEIIKSVKPSNSQLTLPTFFWSTPKATGSASPSTA